MDTYMCVDGSLDDASAMTHLHNLRHQGLLQHEGMTSSHHLERMKVPPISSGNQMCHPSQVQYARSGCDVLE
jgi:hypothetical protein